MTVLSLADVAREISAQDSELLQAVQHIRKRPENVLGLLTRSLSREEIAIMEDRGCRSDDWTLVSVAEDFNAFRVRRTHFVGNCVLGRFSGSVAILPDLELPTGIYDCTLNNCQIGNDCLLENVRYAAHIIAQRESVIFDVGSIICSAGVRFGCDQELPVAVETGGREVPVWAEMRVDTAAVIARNRADREGLQQVAAAIAEYSAAAESDYAMVQKKAIIRHTERVVNTYVGEGALIDHALEIHNSCLLSTMDECTRVSGGAAVHDAVLQWGSVVAGNGIVRNSVLLEHAAVDADGVVEYSIIGPNTSIEKGEVTASLVGPFVGFHHQSLLIAALWPEGRGNIAYGSMVGSNHTSRAPDQEIWPGEGTFFGLGCSIRFPANFADAPYLVIGAGVSTLPQRMSFPFSLINTPVEPVDAETVPRAYNELLPGYGIYYNAYAIERMEIKFARRDKSRRHQFNYQVLRPDIMQKVLTALRALEDISQVREIYTTDDIPGIGKNFMREESRTFGIKAYRRELKRYSLRVLLAEAEGYQQLEGSVEFAHSLLDDLMPDTSLSERLQELIVVEENNARIVRESKEKDDVRGRSIFEDYADAHTSAADDPVVQSAQRRLETTSERVAAVVKNL